MKTIQEVAEQAALVLVFEDGKTLPMTEITFAPKGEEQSYSIRVPKAFLEEIYAMGFRDGEREQDESRDEIMDELRKDLAEWAKAKSLFRNAYRPLK